MSGADAGMNGSRNSLWLIMKGTKHVHRYIIVTYEGEMGKLENLEYTLQNQSEDGMVTKTADFKSKLSEVLKRIDVQALLFSLFFNVFCA